MNGPFCLVVNPSAGRGRSLRVLPQATAVLDAAGAAFRVRESASLQDARDIAAGAARLGEVVVAVGGDGTAGALAGAAAATGAGYGIIPAGNGNDLARVLGIPPGAAAARVLVSGRERRVDLMAVAAGDGPEAIVAGSVYLGIPSVAGEIANRTRWPRGSMVYPAAALRALAGWTPAAFRVEVGPGGRPPHDFDGYAVVVANAAHFGAGMKVAPAAEIDDGQLDIVIMRHGSRLAFLRVLLRIKSGSHLGLPQVSTDRGAEVTVTVGRDLPAAADGETLTCAAPLRPGTSLRIRAMPGALRALVPLSMAKRPDRGRSDREAGPQRKVRHRRGVAHVDPVPTPLTVL
jgi:diacylglycerol kinase (ATP)